MVRLNRSKFASARQTKSSVLPVLYRRSVAISTPRPTRRAIASTLSVVVARYPAAVAMVTDHRFVGRGGTLVVSEAASL